MPVDAELIAEKDALTRDILYHTPCLLREKRACELLDKNVDKKISDVIAITTAWKSTNLIVKYAAKSLKENW